ncbi:MAG: 6-carboxytetrahydropterin synthase [Chloroflexi bacterium]|uniref:6-carboxy-5,6,7,8-tetrahydropterin synthase n=1 Tax=Candidatus Chlorohelix allophototropha TaxID=3003348 RepID=A0A8T7M252_9CHLR|nr:6-carboxytetrahydropterin synthase [Chloroflexota bacterium]WJW66907.1 6-carboxytetrahydropterin synthase [Chloroflexota bacterium L227-S17]
MAVVYLTRRANFSSAHRLHSPELSAEENRIIFGKCNNPNGHGHNYTLEVTVRGEINPVTGMVLNLTELKKAMEEAVIDEVDHKHLNLDVPIFREINPTAENMVVVFWKLLEQRLKGGILHEVKLWETENNVAVYRGE